MGDDISTQDGLKVFKIISISSKTSTGLTLVYEDVNMTTDVLDTRGHEAERSGAAVGLAGAQGRPRCGACRREIGGMAADARLAAAQGRPKGWC